MTEFNYRFSIIPAAAVVDKDLSATSFRVLCLLGRHTNDAGWCSRSQVKMARELGVGRATIYDAMNILYDRAYVERRPNARGSRLPEEGEHPFSAYSYRVKLDRDDLPGRIKDVMDDDEGAAQAAGGAAPPAGGAAQAAPLEGISSEGISSEPERERARAREDQPVSKFMKKWPTSAVDDVTRITKAWQQLTAEQQHQAMAGIDGFLAKLKAEGRTKIIAGWKYLEEQRWTLMPSTEPTDTTGRLVTSTWSREWWASLFDRLATGQSTGFMIRYATERSAGDWQIPNAGDIHAEVLNAYSASGPEIAAWRPWFERRGIRFPKWDGKWSIFLPSPEPPVEQSQPLKEVG